MRSNHRLVELLRSFALIIFMALGLLSPSEAGAKTVTAVLNGGLRALDPIVNTSVVTSIHALMIYDMLLAQDADGKVQPQMASWSVSDDGKVYTFKLRDGLRWHDGKPVTAADCVASIQRWAQVDVMGQIVMKMVANIRAVDDQTFVVEQTQKNDLILKALSKTSARPAVMMPKRMADTPPNQQVSENIGSGPFRFVSEEYKPGIKAVYEKNKDYVPRSEPASGAAGGKVVNVDRVELVTMPDTMTAVNALVNGEIDFLEFVPFDLLPLVEGRDNVTVGVLNETGVWTVARMNFQLPPFNNKLIRKAAMYAIGQESIMQALVGNPKYYQTCPSVYGCGTPYESKDGADMIVSPDPEKAKQLLQEAHYDGTPVVLLHPSDQPLASAQPLVISQQLKDAGFNVDMQTMDWQSLTARRGNSNTPKEGGWNMFVTFSAVGDMVDPISSVFLAAGGKKSWFGWPDVPEIEKLRVDFASAEDEQQRIKLAAEVSKLAVDEGLIIPLGQFVLPSAYSNKLTNLPHYSRPLFWGLKKAD